MISPTLTIYAFATFLIMLTAVLAFNLVIHFLKDYELPERTIELYKLYFFIALIGWLLGGIRNNFYPDSSLTGDLIFYIIPTYVLFLAACNLARQHGFPRYYITFISSVALILGLLVEQNSQTLMVVSVYAMLAYLPLTFIFLKRAKKENNIGEWISSLATCIAGLSGLIQAYILYVTSSTLLVYGIAYVATSVGFLLIGIGFITSILVREHQLLNTLALKDPLTGLLNRRGLDTFMRTLSSNTERNGRELSVIAMDIDYFKKVNDNFGHDGGDTVLEVFAQTIERVARAGDVSCRLGGEEFLLVLPETSITDAKSVAERLRKCIEESTISHKTHEIKITSSFGISSTKGFIAMEKLIREADMALYQAKSEGRNRVCDVTQVSELH